ncbi:SufE protein probably involved in Fe-S center assembly [Prochlorococcus marinus str. MIT 9515]|uniref:SufE protein probably involved in Fe-S center assembly n=1 Tax=Prochlorococcus marinus (strain MIT 9515) TaxID=167542 RepID=A2BX39_PROM5|nr:SufE family protein [Prochlorococcus marinus]ABM72350.1 SufE protein probably involved in Fe-S center assembly [Prochlorococcus marinus str. MIT 9515]
MENKQIYINLFKQVEKLKNSKDPKRKYEYILWLGKKLKVPNSNILIQENKVQGCVSEVFVKATFQDGKLYWEGYSDALITKGLLAFLICGMNELTPKEVVNINNKFIEDTGLKASLTPSRSNGFLNILLKMQSQANDFLSE